MWLPHFVFLHPKAHFFCNQQNCINWQVLLSWFIVQIKWFFSTSHLVWKGIKEMHSLNTLCKRKWEKFSQQLFELYNISYKKRYISFYITSVTMTRNTHVGLFPGSALCSTQQFNLLRLCSLFWKLKPHKCFKRFYCYKVALESKENTVHLVVKPSGHQKKMSINRSVALYKN